MTKATVFATLALLAAPVHAAGQAAAAPNIEGLWGAALRFGPDIRGTLIIYRTADGWRADMAGFSVPARVNGQSVTFTLPDGKGSFHDRHWFQADRYATPVTLVPDGPNRWRGTVTPLESRLTFYLPITRQPDGSLRTYLRNPERNLGRFVRVSRVQIDGKAVRLIGRPGGGHD
jgi:hypothetical protein